MLFTLTKVLQGPREARAKRFCKWNAWIPCSTASISVFDDTYSKNIWKNYYLLLCLFAHVCNWLLDLRLATLCHIHTCIHALLGVLWGPLNYVTYFYFKHIWNNYYLILCLFDHVCNCPLNVNLDLWISFGDRSIMLFTLTIIMQIPHCGFQRAEFFFPLLPQTSLCTSVQLLRGIGNTLSLF